MRRPPRLLAESLLVLATIIWGGTFVATRAGLDYVSPLLIIAVRFLASFMILLPLLALAGVRWWRHIRAGSILGVVLAGGYVLQTVGLESTTATRSAFLTYLFAVLIPPLQRFVSKRRLSAGNLMGLAIVIVGTSLMTHPWESSGWTQGDLITLGGAVCFALFIVLIDRFAQESPAIELVPTQFLVAGLIALGGAVLSHELGLEPLRWSGQRGSLLAIGYLTILGTVGALGLQTVFQVYTTPVRATTIYALEPVFAAIFGILILSERVSPLESVGGAVILAGVFVSELWYVIRKQASPAPGASVSQPQSRRRRSAFRAPSPE
jgi:drug/metabolite transporter (DMT)-like permease